MSLNNTRIIHREDLPLGGFAGIIETRMVQNPKLWKSANERTDISHGLGDFLYLATGHFKPDDGAPLHPHRNVDIVSFIPKGAVGHEGTMGHGTTIQGPGVQVQRAGTGIEHAEFSLNGEKADLVQLWFSPPENDLEPGYQEYKLESGKMTTVLGGHDDSVFANNMTCEVGLLPNGSQATTDHPFIAFLYEGEATANGLSLKSGDLIEGDALDLVTHTPCSLVLIQFTKTF
ncbi:Quercetin 2,3-dioxygenase [Pseudovibrio axinellae]|uniref:Quercetin 2,3-dioxygenase n=1 Tax=Pseudovibrio axinellae TaxID=989403 RepID=A0A166APE0_9HYPH|nr:pirin family protein [Pseudovibrio axinellae]KZL21380.1 Quercetin 2,3-dioxygenase [Pseudovibrio axinellae]SEQ98097.1 hypothetical protein SAMN05421798_105294 [Pseudovibrio axinellae]